MAATVIVVRRWRLLLWLLTIIAAFEMGEFWAREQTYTPPWADPLKERAISYFASAHQGQKPVEERSALQNTRASFYEDRSQRCVDLIPGAYEFDVIYGAGFAYCESQYTKEIKASLF